MRNIAAAPGEIVVDANKLMTGLDQFVTQVTAQEPRAPCDQDAFCDRIDDVWNL